MTLRNLVALKVAITVKKCVPWHLKLNKTVLRPNLKADGTQKLHVCHNTRNALLVFDRQVAPNVITDNIRQIILF